MWNLPVLAAAVEHQRAGQALSAGQLPREAPGEFAPLIGVQSSQERELKLSSYCCFFVLMSWSFSAGGYSWTAGGRLNDTVIHRGSLRHGYLPQSASVEVNRTGFLGGSIVWEIGATEQPLTR